MLLFSVLYNEHGQMQLLPDGIFSEYNSFIQFIFLTASCTNAVYFRELLTIN